MNKHKQLMLIPKHIRERLKQLKMDMTPASAKEFDVLLEKMETKIHTDRTKAGYVPWDHSAAIRDLRSPNWGCHIYGWVLRTIDNIKRFPRECQWFIQRGKRGYADCDIWHIGYYISDIMEQMIDELRWSHTGVPGRVCLEKDVDEADREDWIPILENIMFTFKMSKQIIEQDLLYFPSESYYTELDEWEKAVPKITRGRYQVMSKFDCERYEEGFEQLKKYIGCLWD